MAFAATKGISIAISLMCLTFEVTDLARLYAQGPVDRRVGHQFSRMLGVTALIP